MPLQTAPLEGATTSPISSREGMGNPGAAWMSPGWKSSSSALSPLGPACPATCAESIQGCGSASLPFGRPANRGTTHPLVGAGPPGDATQRLREDVGLDGGEVRWGGVQAAKPLRSLAWEVQRAT